MRLVRSPERPECLQLHNDPSVTHEVRPVARGQGLTLEPEPQGDLGAVRDLPAAQLARQRLPIHGFEESCTQMAMHVHGRADDGVGFRVAYRSGCGHPARISSVAGIAGI